MKKYASGSNGSIAKNVLYKKPCKCIGSIAIPQQFRNDAQLFINEKFDEMKDVVKGIPVVVMVTDEGVKILRDNDESVVRMAHGVPKILFSTCQPERKLFAYVAKARTQDRKSVLQVHLFKTKKSSHTKELNASLSKAFKAFANKATVERKQVMKSFDVETPENRNPEIRGKRWAKHEIARGHQNAGHAQQAQQRMSQLVDVGTTTPSESPAASNQNQKRSTPAKKISKQQYNKLSNSADRIRSIHGSPQNSFSESDSEKVASSTGDESSSSASELSKEETERVPSEEKPKTRKLQRSEECDELAKDEDPPETLVRVKSTQSCDEDDILDLSGNNIPTSSKSRTIATPAQRFSTVVDPNIESTPTFPSSLPSTVLGEKPLPPPPPEQEENLNMKSLCVSDKPPEGYVNITADKSHQPLPPLPDDKNISDHGNTSVRDSQMFEMTEDDILRNAEWFQEGFSREVAESVLSDRSVGAFFVRSSQTKRGNFALTVRIPTTVKENGIGNFLIEFNDSSATYNLRGHTARFTMLSDLVAHYGSVNEDLPVQLQLMNSNNTLYRMKKSRTAVVGDSTDRGGGGGGGGLDVVGGGKSVDIEDDEDDDEDDYTDIDYLRFTSADEMMRELDELRAT